MRRLLFTLAALAALAGPVGALAARGTAGDGTLAIRHASGDALGQPVVRLSLDGAVVGNVTGRLVIVPVSGSLPSVVGADGSTVTPVVNEAGALVYQGNGLRFRAVGGIYKVTIFGRGIDLNAVGQGRVVLDGSSQAPSVDGKFSANGSAWASLPPTPTAYTITA